MAAMMYAIQFLIVLGVLWANIYFEWTPNGFVAAGLAFGAAYLFTLAVNGLRDRRTRKRAAQGRFEQ